MASIICQLALFQALTYIHLSLAFLLGLCVCVGGGSKNVLVPHFALAYITVTDSATPITGIGVT